MIKRISGHRGNSERIIRDLKRSRAWHAMTEKEKWRIKYEKAYYDKFLRGGGGQLDSKTRSTQRFTDKSLGHYDTLFNKAAFTLAEVLITLGIIGVVAALTLPTLIQNYEKHTVETRLAKFYSTINQAVRRSEVDNGPAKFWLDSERRYHSIEEITAFYNTYFKNYIKSQDIEEINSDTIVNDEPLKQLLIHMEDGSAFAFILEPNGIDIGFYPNYAQFKKFGNTARTFFPFNFLKRGIDERLKYSVEPYSFEWDGTEEGLRSGRRGCYEGGSNTYCTKLIQINGWKIPDNYPW